MVQRLSFPVLLALAGNAAEEDAKKSVVDPLVSRKETGVGPRLPRQALR
jgi:hypothetical protein